MTGDAIIAALQLAVVPPFTPIHDHRHLLSLVTDVAPPASQRFVVGAVANVPFSAEPQSPFTGRVVMVTGHVLERPFRVTVIVFDPVVV